MPEKHIDKQTKTSIHTVVGDALFALGTPYRWVVGGVTKMIAPTLHRITERFIDDAIERNKAQDNPRLQKLLTFEIERRAYGPGQTQDVAEPAFWQGIKILAALTLPVATKFIEDRLDRKNHIATRISLGAGVAIIIKESIEFLRLPNRFVAGLQGSEKMALDREAAIQRTGIDPFGASVTKVAGPQNSPFTEKTSRKSITPDAVAERTAAQDNTPMRY